MSDGKLKTGLWVNDRREKDTQPHLKVGKPVEFNGQQYWVSAWISTGGPRGDNKAKMEEQVAKFLSWMATHCGTSPVIQIEVQLADQQQGGQKQMAPPINPDDDCPF